MINVKTDYLSLVILTSVNTMKFSRQEYWSGLPFPPPGGLPDPGIEPTSLASPALADGFLSTESPGKAMSQHPQASRVKPHSGFRHCPWRESTL